jgi:hypothetical protein
MRTKVWEEIMSERNHLEDLDIDGKVVLKLIK